MAVTPAHHPSHGIAPDPGQDSANWLSSLYASFPLPEQKKVIRVLVLSPNTNLDANPEVEFIILSLDAKERHPFWALSYVWGNISDQKPVMLHGQPILIGKNLHSALRHVRSRNMLEPRMVWADAICINQMDVDERSRQVGLMRTLYANAETIILWQGEPTEALKGEPTEVIKGEPTEVIKGEATCTEVIEGAMALVSSFVDSWIDFGDKFVQCLLAQSDADNPDHLKAFAKAILPILVEEPSCDRRKILRKSFIALAENIALGPRPLTAFIFAISCILGENPFWSRLWILQETVIAMRQSSGVLQIGSHTIQLEKMLHAVLIYYVAQTRLAARGRSVDAALDTTGPLLAQRFGLAWFRRL